MPVSKRSGVGKRTDGKRKSRPVLFVFNKRCSRKTFRRRKEEKRRECSILFLFNQRCPKKLLDRNWIKSLFYELAENHQKSPYEVIVCRGGEEAEDFEHFLRMGLVGKTAAGSTLEERVPPIITLPKGTEEDLRIYGRRTYFFEVDKFPPFLIKKGEFAAYS